MCAPWCGLWCFLERVLYWRTSFNAVVGWDRQTGGFGWVSIGSASTAKRLLYHWRCGVSLHTLHLSVVFFSFFPVGLLTVRFSCDSCYICLFFAFAPATTEDVRISWDDVTHRWHRGTAEAYVHTLHFLFTGSDEVRLEDSTAFQTVVFPQSSAHFTLNYAQTLRDRRSNVARDGCAVV